MNNTQTCFPEKAQSPARLSLPVCIILATSFVAAAAIATAFYLLAPFAILISRSFQPEPLMTMMFAVGIYTILNYYENQSLKRLLIMAVVSGLAILAKVNIIFPIWTAFITGGISKEGLRRTVFSKQHMGFATIASVVGFVPLAVAVLGILLLRDKTVRSILIGLNVGYLVYALIFAYTTATNDYYQVQVVPIVALALAPAIAFFLNQLLQKNSPLRRLTITIGLLLLAALLTSLVSIKTSAFRTENKYIKPSLAFAYKCFGLRPDYLSQFSADYPNFIERAENIGLAVNHSDKTITLGIALPLWYYGQYAGHRWPPHRHWPFPDAIGSIGTGAKWRKYKGLSAEELFEQHFSGFSPEYFVVTALEDFEKQKSLKEFLYGKFKALVHKEKYLIFDLTKPKQ